MLPGLATHCPFCPWPSALSHPAAGLGLSPQGLLSLLPQHTSPSPPVIYPCPSKPYPSLAGGLLGHLLGCLKVCSVAHCALAWGWGCPSLSCSHAPPSGFPCLPYPLLSPNFSLLPLLILVPSAWSPSDSSFIPLFTVPSKCFLLFLTVPWSVS